MSHPYCYVLIRRDISLPQQLVQGCHAAREAALFLESPAETASVIVCTVADRDALMEAAARLERHGIESQLFFEPDFDMGYSALCTKPLLNKKQRYVMSKYPLFGREPQHEPAHVG